MRHFLFACLFGFLAMLSKPPMTHAAGLVEPTLEQQAHCARIPSEQGRRPCLDGYRVPPLTLPADVSEGKLDSATRMGIAKPPGPGPFPAIILMHTCAALSLDSQMPFWVSSALQRGYVVFVLDSFSQRGISNDNGCHPGSGPIPWQMLYGIRARDAYAAADRLATFSFVDRTRIAAMGFSQGGRVAYMLSGDGSRQAFSAGAAIAATVAVYGQCYSPTLKVSFVPAAPAIPILSLLGAEDTDGYLKACVPLFERARASGALVEWTIFHGVGHNWDNPRNIPGRHFPFPDSPDGTLYVEYDSTTTLRSREIAFEFLARNMR